MSEFTLGGVHTVRSHSLRRSVAGVATWVVEMLRTRSSRRLLGGLDDRMLADIGVGRGEALDEANRAMWDLRRRAR